MNFYLAIVLFILLTIILLFNISNTPDLWLNISHLSIDKISLAADNLKASVSVSAKIANLVSFNTGVNVTMGKVKLTSTGINAQVQLAVRLNNIVRIISRTMTSLDLNPFLASTSNNDFE
ncbi:unnamed protein product [Adineta steineri]|uniref:Uncharacterized protein n=1 Tax=Adineta steineri TaxID=433720 RepID=A0A813PQP3_9BILA|nr:unnamed protein product [Adineta steineri]CAF3483660.1 unnamed protein product [Adineta steineri]